LAQRQIDAHALDKNHEEQTWDDHESGTCKQHGGILSGGHHTAQTPCVCRAGEPEHND